MDITSLLLGFGSLALFVVPMVLLHRAQRAKGKQLLGYFKKLAEQQQLQITQSEVWGNYYCIGIDTQAKKLFYLKRKDGLEQPMVIDLVDVEKCSVVKKKRTVKLQSGIDTVTDRLDLNFKFRDRSPDRNIEFYNSEENMVITGELPLVEKWAGLVNSVKREMQLA